MAKGTVRNYTKRTYTGQILDGEAPPRIFSLLAGDIVEGEENNLKNHKPAFYDPYVGDGGVPRARNVRTTKDLELQSDHEGAPLAGIARISSYRSGLGGLLALPNTKQRIRFSDRVVSPVDSKLNKGDEVEFTLYSKERRGVWAKRVKKIE